MRRDEMVRRLLSAPADAGHAARMELQDELASDIRRRYPNCPAAAAQSCAAAVTRRAAALAAAIAERADATLH